MKLLAFAGWLPMKDAPRDGTYIYAMSTWGDRKVVAWDAIYAATNAWVDRRDPREAPAWMDGISIYSDDDFVGWLPLPEMEWEQ